tara:strand:- start:323 stop:577 length:255 start_codon:yes stop_codon:yes gene_type:complete
MVGRPLYSKRCGAYARSTGLPCKAKALPNGKCRNHGGLSTGPKTKEGKLKALMNLKHVKDKLKTKDTYNIREAATGHTTVQDMQ